MFVSQPLGRIFRVVVLGAKLQVVFFFLFVPNYDQGHD